MRKAAIVFAAVCLVGCGISPQMRKDFETQKAGYEQREEALESKLQQVDARLDAGEISRDQYLSQINVLTQEVALQRRLARTVQGELDRTDTIVKSDQVAAGFKIADKALVAAGPIATAFFPAAAGILPVLSGILSGISGLTGTKKGVIA